MEESHLKEKKIYDFAGRLLYEERKQITLGPEGSQKEEQKKVRRCPNCGARLDLYKPKSGCSIPGCKVEGTCESCFVTCARCSRVLCSFHRTGFEGSTLCFRCKEEVIKQKVKDLILELEERKFARQKEKFRQKRKLIQLLYKELKTDNQSGIGGSLTHKYFSFKTG